ncbi:protein adenylyltransferase SelO [Marinobacterium weihaiense]|uniref:Protein nucleotidyltransferase YdiU n=1 Tax=Marinobacterium weihaiense TaxID=2851016 RepID=A0ABS6M8A0_9GAMM|nr:YdiU family protein [Marinobacterium weihaiense]MBV0932012.1 YdiU family protein [Marinobacterium weihaiense]
MNTGRTLDQLNFDNSYARLPAHWFQRTAIQPLKNAHLIAFSADVASRIGMDACAVSPQALADCCNGQQPLPGTEPLAMKYTGHQFGSYNPDLGDGRGVLLGEVLNAQGERYDLHVKGAGKTAFSRFGDGRAVLRSSIREYLAGEAMAGLGIPTTRALCLVGSEDYTLRNGMEPCALLMRVTPCHVRFGHFEYFYYSGQHEDLRRLADYCLQRYFPQLKADVQPYRAMYREVLERTARLSAAWQAYGFVHGVLNTDNMSLIGETFDFGPYTFLDHYEPDHVANKNDHQARYAFSKQPSIVLWNLAALAQAMLPLVERAELEAELDRFESLYQAAYLERMKARLGLQAVEPDDQALVDRLVDIWTRQRIDHNRFLRQLSEWQQDGDDEAMLSQATQPDMLREWLAAYRTRLAAEAASAPMRCQQMRSVNPRFILRNYMAEEVIREAHQGDYRPLQALLPLLRHPSDSHPGFERFAGPPPNWAESIHLTCSS